MRWSGDVDLDDDILEPLQPGSEDTLPGFDAAAHRATRRAQELEEPSRLRITRPKNPKAMRLWLIASGLGAMSLLQFAGAAYVRGVDRDLRAVERVWHAVLAVDADRERADDALADTQREYGDSPGLDDQRDLLYDAARARFEKLAVELDELSPGADSVADLRDDMAAALQQRRSDFRREFVPGSRRDHLRELGRRLEKAMDRWRVDPDERTDEVRLTAARELVERLGRMADEPTGLTIGAISTDALLVIDVDANDVVRHRMQLSPTARVHAVGDDLVVIDGGKARAFDSRPLRSTPRWEVEAERAVPSSDGESLWVQVGPQLQRLDGNGQPLITVAVPQGSRLVGAPTPTRALVVTPADGLVVTNRDGGLEPGAEYRRVNRPFRAGTNGVYAAALDDRGRVLLARIDGPRQQGFTYAALRADLPRIVDVAVIP